MCMFDTHKYNQKKFQQNESIQFANIAAQNKARMCVCVFETSSQQKEKRSQRCEQIYRLCVRMLIVQCAYPCCMLFCTYYYNRQFERYCITLL